MKYLLLFLMLSSPAVYANKECDELLDQATDIIIVQEQMIEKRDGIIKDQKEVISDLKALNQSKQDQVDAYEASTWTLTTILTGLLFVLVIL